MEPLFEQYPWLLIPIIIAVVEAWAALKAGFRSLLDDRRHQTGDTSP